MRPLLIGLLLVNAGLVAAQLGGADRWLNGGGPREHEPERMQRQLNPGALRVQPLGAAVMPPAGGLPARAASVPAPVLPAGAAPAAALAPPPLASRAQATPAPASAPAAVPASAASAPQRAGRPGDAARACLEAGPFDGATLAAAQRVLREAGLPESAWHAASAPAAPRHVILMGRYADPEHLQRKTGELQRKGVSFVLLRESPDIPAKHLPGLVLGRYADARAAESALTALRNRGVVSARLVVLDAQPAGTLLRVADPGRASGPKARTAAPALPGHHAWRPCAAAV